MEYTFSLIFKFEEEILLDVCFVRSLVSRFGRGGKVKIFSFVNLYLFVFFSGGGLVCRMGDSLLFKELRGFLLFWGLFLFLS